LALRFRLNITDADGDTDQTPANNDIVINVLDDAPVAQNDGSFNVASGANFIGATTLLANDTLSRDGSNTVTQVKFGNQTVNVPTTGSITINGTYGVLTVRADGSYSYQAGTNAGGSDTFAYVVRDADGDTSQANLSFNTAAPTPFGVVVEAHHACGYEDSCAVLDFRATRTGGDGDEVITVRIEGVPAGWRIEYPAGTFVASTGAAWTYTLAAGQNFVSDPNLGGVKLWPPANSDADISGLRITATIHDPDTNTSAAGNVTLSDVVIDAVVDVPDVTATVGNVVNGQAAVNVTASLSDTDGSESLTVIRLMAVNSSGQLVGLPYGITFNKGHAVGGEWHLTTAELAGLKMNVPSWFNQDFRLGVMAVAEETSAGQGSNREFDYTNNATFDLFVVDHAVNFGATSSPSLTVTSSASTSNTSASGTVTLNSFNAAEGDTLDISNVIAVDTTTDHAINDFVYANSTNVTVQSTAGDITVQGVDQVNMNDIITLAQVNQNNGQI
jgi:VCBS repeat-containing protein